MYHIQCLFHECLFCASCLIEAKTGSWRFITPTNPTVASKVVAKPPSTSAPAMSVLDNDPMSTGGHAHVRHLRSTDTESFMAEDQPPL